MTTTLAGILVRFGVLTVLVIFLSGCMTEPITGRRQFNVISPGQEMQLGLSSFQQMKKEVPTAKNNSAQATVEKVGRRIAAVAAKDLPNAQWEFVVFESKEINAFCLPGGKVGVYTGILAVTQDEAGLATVLGHEVAHAAAHHGAERMSTALATQTVGQAVAVGLSATATPATQAAFGTIYGLGSQLGVALPHNRRQEAAADEIGLMYMATAGYDPRKALDFWRRFSQATGGKEGPFFLRTHPVTADRIKHLEELMPKAIAEFERSTATGR